MDIPLFCMKKTLATFIYTTVITAGFVLLVIGIAILTCSVWSSHVWRSLQNISRNDLKNILCFIAEMGAAAIVIGCLVYSWAWVEENRNKP